MTNTSRKIQKIFLAREQNEGAGARVRRSIGSANLKNFTPFLMLDHFNVSPDAGFPDHPHRGQETITYLIEGEAVHEDFAGNKGRLEAGDLQFMTAGRGIVHAEMPAPGTHRNIGMQLWVDLPKELKMCEPRYRDLRDAEIPRAKADDGKVEIKVISGKSQGVDSVKDLAYTPVWFLDILIHPGGKITQDLPKGWNAFAYLMQGVADFSNGDGKTDTVVQYNNVIFDQAGESVTISVEEGASEDARVILIAGQPLDQPIVQYGPFVMTSRDEMIQTVMDYNTRTNGFERADNWESEIGRTMSRVH